MCVCLPLQVLAKGIYDELQGMMNEFGQESIANLMPLVVNVLENLDSALADNQVSYILYMVYIVYCMYIYLPTVCMYSI